MNATIQVTEYPALETEYQGRTGIPVEEQIEYEVFLFRESIR